MLTGAWLAALGLEHGALARDDQVARDLRAGIGEHLADLALLGDAAVVDDGDAVADLVDDLHFVRDDDDRHAQGLVDLAQQLQDRAGRRGIERAGRLVAEQVFRLGRQRPRDRDALLLAAGELGGIGLRPVGQADKGEELHRPLLCLLFLDARDLQREADVAQHAALLEEIEALEDHADGAAELQKFPARQSGNALAVDDHFAGARLLEQVDAAHQRLMSSSATMSLSAVR